MPGGGGEGESCERNYIIPNTQTDIACVIVEATSNSQLPAGLRGADITRRLEDRTTVCRAYYIVENILYKYNHLPHFKLLR